MTSNNRRLPCAIGASSSRSSTVVALLALAWLASCSLRDLGELSAGDSAVAGRSSVGVGGLPAAGASSGATGASPTGSTAGIGGSTSATQGGTTTTGGTTVALGGATATGAVTGTAGSTAKEPCPGATTFGGSMLTPPSNDFERDATEWSTTLEHVHALSVFASADESCQGTQYLSCEGASRGDMTDGPGIDILPYVVPGHDYMLSFLGRFDPGNAPTTNSSLIVTLGKTCQDSKVAKAYVRITDKAVGTQWIRIASSAPFQVDLANCPKLLRTFVYVETLDNGLGKTIDIDDFQLWDVTPPATGTGGAGGGGSSGSAGAAGFGS